jgi:hypothetical protein
VPDRTVSDGVSGALLVTGKHALTWATAGVRLIGEDRRGGRAPSWPTAGPGGQGVTTTRLTKIFPRAGQGDAHAGGPATGLDADHSAISVRLDPEAMQTLAPLEATGISRS